MSEQQNQEQALQEPGLLQSPSVERALAWAAVLVAVLPRVWAVGVRPYSALEAAVALQTRQPFGTLIQILKLKGEAMVPFDLRFTLVAKAWAAIGGTGEWWMRLLPCLLGIAGVWFVWRAAALLMNRGAALLATVIVAGHPHLIDFSRTLDGNSMSFFLCAAAFYFFLKAFRGRASAADFLFYTLFMLAAICLYMPSAVLLLPFQILFFGFREKNKDDIIPWVIANIVLIAVAALWFPFWQFATSEAVKPGSHFMLIYDDRLMSQDLLFRIFFIEFYLKTLFAMGGFLKAITPLNILTLAAVIMIPLLYHAAMFYGFREYKDGLRDRVLFLTGLSVTWVAGGLLSVFGTNPAVAMIPSYMLFACLTAGGISRFASRRLTVAFLAMIAVIVLGGCQEINSRNRMAPDWRSVAEQTQKLNKHGAPVLVAQGWDGPGIVYYTHGQTPHMECMFQDFAPLMLKNDRYLQEEITEPYRSYFDTYTGRLRQLVKQHGRVVLILRDQDASEFHDPPRNVKVYIRWVEAMVPEGILIKEEKNLGRGIVAWVITLRGDPDEVELW